MEAGPLAMVLAKPRIPVQYEATLGEAEPMQRSTDGGSSRGSLHSARDGASFDRAGGRGSGSGLDVGWGGGARRLLSVYLDSDDAPQDTSVGGGGGVEHQV